MNYVNLGKTGLKVSRICLGCMSYGKPKVAPEPGMLNWPWTLSEEESRPYIKHADEEIGRLEELYQYHPPTEVFS